MARRKFVYDSQKKIKTCKSNMKSHITPFLIFSYRFWKIFWVDATTSQTLAASFREIAHDLSAKNDGVEDSIESIICWLSHKPREWLLIFDNVDEDLGSITRFLVPSSHGNALITTRYLNVRELVDENSCAQVGQMNEEEAILLLSRVAHRCNSSDETQDSMRLIVNKFGSIPLAIQHAGTAIANGMNCRDYLEILHKHPLRPLAHLSWTGASQNLISIWETAFATIQGNAVSKEDQVSNSAPDIFQIFSFFHPNGIMDDIFRRAASFRDVRSSEEKFRTPASALCRASDYLPLHILPIHKEGDWDPLTFKEGVRMLHKHSFIQFDVSNNTYSIHPLLHFWARHRIPEAARGDTFRTASALLAGAIGSQKGQADYVFRRQLIPHVYALYRFHAELKLSDEYYDDVCEKFWFLFEENEYWKDAEREARKMMEKRRIVLGERHPKTAKSMCCLAIALQGLGRRDEAKDFQQEALAIRRESLGEDHIDTLESKRLLAMIYFDQARYEDAVALQANVLETQTRCFGDNDWRTLKSATDLGGIYREQNKYKEAAAVLKRVVDCMKETLHPDALFAAEAMAGLAAAYHSLRQLGDAEILKSNVLTVRKKVLGDKHPATLMAMANLVATYVRQGSQDKLNTAVELIKRVIVIRKELLGEHHRDTLTSLLILTNFYINKGMLEDAECTCLQVIEGREVALPSNHPHTIWSKATLALIYRYQGRLDESEEKWKCVISAQENVHGRGNGEALLYKYNLALVLKSQGSSDALRLMKEVCDLTRQRPDFWTIESERLLKRWQDPRTQDTPEEYQKVYLGFVPNDHEKIIKAKWGIHRVLFPFWIFFFGCFFFFVFLLTLVASGRTLHSGI